VCGYVQGGLGVRMLFILLMASPAIKFIMLVKSAGRDIAWEFYYLRLGGEEKFNLFISIVKFFWEIRLDFIADLKFHLLKTKAQRLQYS
jgi:hypothetical protein